MSQKISENPKDILKNAVAIIDVFTEPQASRLEVESDGRLVAIRESRLDRVVALAECRFGPLFSGQLRKKQEMKREALKKTILRARDHIQSHSALIEKYQKGDEAQQKLAEMILRAIERYNAVVGSDSLQNKHSDINYDRHQLLLDNEIKGQKIELPVTYIKTYDSHSLKSDFSPHLAQKTLQGLSNVFGAGAAKTNQVSLSTPIHKKTEKYLTDSFRLKATQMIKEHLKKTHEEILSFFRQSSPQIDDSHPKCIAMQQLIRLEAGSWILVSGSFHRPASQTSSLSISMPPTPIRESFRISFQWEHTGFPYPSQHTGWTLDDQWVEASPLRTDQTPLFHQLNQRKKQLANRLLFNEPFREKVRLYCQARHEAFDRHRTLFLPLHRKLYEALLHKKSEALASLDLFYQEAMQASSSFDYLSNGQQQLLDLFVKHPIKALEEEWLGGGATPLRIGQPQDKLHAAINRLEFLQQEAVQKFDSNRPQEAVFLKTGTLIGKAFQSIALQYQSEKMGFSPPLLKNCERKLQACAFQQLSSFLDLCDTKLDRIDPDQVKEDLLSLWSKDLALIEGNIEEENHPSFAIVNELEYYFNSRFYTQTT